jgi:hypothetical protein
MTRMNERRALPRDAVHLEATIVTGGGVTRFDGAVLNITANGARVDVPADHELPDSFYMLMPAVPDRLARRHARRPAIRKPAHRQPALMRRA